MGSAAIVAAAVTQATRASGVIVQMSPQDFLTILGKSERPLVVMAHPRFLMPRYQYLTAYRGLAFYTRSAEPLRLPGNVELVEARSIWIPS